MSRGWIAVLAGVVAAVAVAACGAQAAAPHSVTIGVLYPTSGSQGVQGTEEQRGALLAIEWANDHHVGETVKFVAADVERPEGVPAAMASLQRRGVSIVVGSHGSEFSAVAAAEATRRHMLLWETGAVGQTDGAVHGGANFVRMAPMGANLGQDAVDFVREGLAPQFPPAARATPLKWAVAYVDDLYGRAVGGGAAREAQAVGEPVVGTFAYPAAGTDFAALASRIAASHPTALFVSAYLDDGVALRRALVAAKVPLLVNIGTSSSYCHPAFGQALQGDAVGVFASDKPDAGAVRASALSDEGRSSLAWASATYEARYHEAMSSHALSGFSNTFALLVDVLPKADTATASGVAAAALSVKLPVGSLANGGGLDIAPPGSADAGNNRNAAGVIWEWVAPGRRAVVWPPAYATHPVVWMPIDG